MGSGDGAATESMFCKVSQHGPPKAPKGPTKAFKQKRASKRPIDATIERYVDNDLNLAKRAERLKMCSVV